MINFGKFSVNNGVFLNIVMVTILILGGITLWNMPKEAMSDVSYPFGIVMVYYPGVSVEDVEKTITAKIENEISDIRRLRRIMSVTQEGFAYLMIEFDGDISESELQTRITDLQSRINRISLPDGALDPYVSQVSISEFMPVIQLNIASDSTISDEEMNEIARAIRTDLLSIRDVSKVDIVGGRDREVEIAVNRERAEAIGVSVTEIMNAVQNRHISIPAGALKTITENFYVRTEGEVEDRQDFGNIIIRQQINGANVKVGDVANISNGLAKSKYDMRFNGNDVIALPISKTAQGNSIRVVNTVKERIKTYEESQPNLTFFWSGDSTIQIQDILNSLANNAWSGLLLLFLIMLLFLGWRNAIISCVEIPLTFAAVFIIMSLYGETLNGNSMFALVLVLGLVVDHAIVIMENMYRHLQLGKDKKTAAIDGTNEVAIPVISATLTTIAVFLPLILLPGIMGKFMRPIPVLISVALAVSTLFALMFIPIHFAEFGKKSVKEPQWFIRIREFFRRAATFCYMRKIRTLLVVFAFVILLPILAAPFIKVEFFAQEFMSQFMIDIEMARGTNRATTNKVVEKFEKRILPLVGNGEIVGVSASVGYQMTDTEWVTRDNVAQINVLLAERSEGRTRDIPAIMKEVEKLCQGIPGAETIKFYAYASGPPVEKPILIQVMGENLTEMAEVSDRFQRRLASFSNLYNIGDNFERTSPELIVKINERAAAQYGLTVAQIGSFLRIGIDGVKVATWFDNNDEVDVVIRFSEGSMSSVEQLQTLKIPTMHGTFVPFSAVAQLVENNGISQINRIDRKRTIKITADTDDKSAVPQINREISEWFNREIAPNYPTIQISLEGEWAEMMDFMSDLIPLFFFGMFLLYLILGTQFKSYIQPFLMIFSIPLAVLGVILFLAVSGTPVSVIVMYAFIALAGIATNDSIVLISYINHLRRIDGLNTTEAVIEGVVTRLRPIILTTVSTIGGLLPLALGFGGKSEVWAPMASTIIFGLIFSTLGTLLVIPCIYGVMDDVGNKFGRKMQLAGE